MADFKFSDAFLDTAYMAIAYSQCESEADRKFLEVISTVCKLYGISFKSYIEAGAEINRRMKELSDGD